jgi:hypothetical protein
MSKQNRMYGPVCLQQAGPSKTLCLKGAGPDGAVRALGSSPAVGEQYLGHCGRNSGRQVKEAM